MNPKPKNRDRLFADPSALTQYEKKILDLYVQGKSNREIAVSIGTKDPRAIASRMVIIKEKLESAQVS